MKRWHLLLLLGNGSIDDRGSGSLLKDFIWGSLWILKMKSLRIAEGPPILHTQASLKETTFWFLLVGILPHPNVP
jgi:hypothetical protein